MNTELPDFLANSDPTWLGGVGLVIAVAIVVIIWVIYTFRHPSDEIEPSNPPGPSRKDDSHTAI